MTWNKGKHSSGDGKSRSEGRYRELVSVWAACKGMFYIVYLELVDVTWQGGSLKGTFLQAYFFVTLANSHDPQVVKDENLYPY